MKAQNVSAYKYAAERTAEELKSVLHTINREGKEKSKEVWG